MSSRKKYTKRDEEIRMCKIWLQEPLVNPETGKSIDRNGPTFKKWQERCKRVGLRSRPVATRTMTWRKYQEWKRNPRVNPDTGRKIAIGGPTYRRLQKQCRTVERTLTLEGTYFIPDKSGMVPVKIENAIIYILRKKDNHNIYGPLNKFTARKPELRYYKDTWDYHYGHYRPIFMNKRAPKRPVDQKPSRRVRNRDHKKPTTAAAENPKYIVDRVINLFIPKTSGPNPH